SLAQYHRRSRESGNPERATCRLPLGPACAGATKKDPIARMHYWPPSPSSSRSSKKRTIWTLCALGARRQVLAAGLVLTGHGVENGDFSATVWALPMVARRLRRLMIRPRTIYIAPQHFS